MVVVWIVFGLINLASFILYGVDKRRAKKGKWRIPEATLILIAFLGGGIGALLGMLVWRHKTQHAKFKIFVPIAIVVNIAVLILLMKLFHVL